MQKICLCIFLYFIIIGILDPSVSQRVQIHVDSNVTIGNINHFWKSTGFCPPLPHEKAADFVLSQDMRHNLEFIAALPSGGIEQVRIHWLLDLVTLKYENDLLFYNFTYLDEFISLLEGLGLHPGFELMGNPSNWFNNFENKTQVYWWKDFIYTLTKHYADFYGLRIVKNWNFESWNEPDHHDFDSLNFTIQGFLNYYDACSEGLKEVSPLLIFGGPGESFKISQMYSWALLQHCDNGSNFFTGEHGVRLDFISFHKKGNGSSQFILQQELDTFRKIQSRHPKFALKPIYNDEADPIKGWSTPRKWQADSTYAAMVIKVIAQHQKLLLNNTFGINYTLLSNDNAFLNYYPYFFEQRTLLARFQMNNTDPPHVQFVRKPIYAVMGLLAFLGETEIKSQITINGSRNLDDKIGVLANIHVPDFSHTSDSWQASILIYNSDDTSSFKSQTDFKIILNNIQPYGKKGKSLRWTKYLVDNNVTNPYGEWLFLNKPVFPTREQFHRMRAHEGPIRIGMPEDFPNSGNFAFNWSLLLPGVVLFHICEKPQLPPNQVTNVNVDLITHQQVLITWSDDCVHSRCLLTFEVEFSSTSDEGPYKRINHQDTIFTIYIFAPNCSTEWCNVTGYYRVRAVDYWAVAGDYSIPVYYNSLRQKNIRVVSFGSGNVIYLYALYISGSNFSTQVIVKLQLCQLNVLMKQ